jgi:hypothetical protein
MDLVVTSSSHYCAHCRKYCNSDLADLALPGCPDTRRVIQWAVRLVVEDGMPYRPASWHLWRDPRGFVPFGTLQHWGEAGGKKAHGQMDGALLDWALASFSGSVAADELYEGSSCVVGRRPSTGQADALCRARS